MGLFSQIWELAYVFLLLINAVAILNEERFLARSAYTWLLTVRVLMPANPSHMNSLSFILWHDSRVVFVSGCPANVQWIRTNG